MTRWPGNAERETTTFGGLSRGQLMARVRSKNNRTTEERLVEFLRCSRLTGWRRHWILPGKPDFAWPNVKVAVFVDGCFWHGHNCGKNVTPRTNVDAWAEKIRRNRARDVRVNKLLRQRGWSVIRIWECKLKAQPRWCVSRIERAIDLAGNGKAKGHKA